MSSTILAFAFGFATQVFNLPIGLLPALCYVESGHHADSVHVLDGNANSIGVCQIKLQTARLVGFKGSEKDLKTPFTNIYYSAAYLSHQLTRYRGDIRKGVAAYNAGRYRENDKGLIMNRKYVQKVFKEWSTNY
jgi:soluble lytic murein transglycosylase-like protein